MAINFVSFEEDQAEARLIVYELNEVLKDMIIHRDNPSRIAHLQSRRNQLLDQLTGVRRRQLEWDARYLVDSPIRPS